jgi:hypothetical protein
MGELFKVGDRVRIAETYHWAKGTLGTIDIPPSFVRQLAQDSEGWVNARRIVSSLHGPLTFYWVEFDTPQDDADGDGPYQGAEIDSRYLSLVTEDPTNTLGR